MIKNLFLLLLGLIAAFVLAEDGDTCNNAIKLELGTVYELSTVGRPESMVGCGRVSFSSRGVWFTYVGNGYSILLSTCDDRTTFDSVIMVFDSCTTSTDHCVAMDDDSCLDQRAQVLLPSEKLHYYHIFVGGYQDEVGTFYFTATQQNPPDNYNCSAAEDIPYSKLPFAASGDTSKSLAVANPCIREGLQSSGLWYRLHVNSDNIPIFAHTCSSNTNFDSILAVYKGCSEEEGARDCETWNDNGCNELASVAFWRANSNTDYWIFVTGVNNARGRFTLAVEEHEMNPYCHCSDAYEIKRLPFFDREETEYAELTYSDCFKKNLHSMYYRITGPPKETKRIVATTCNTFSFVNDTILSVFESCDTSSGTGVAGKCIAFNDDYCGFGASLDFIMQAGKTYYIAVSSGADTIEGIAFSLKVSEYENIQNDECYAAKEVTSTPAVLEGNTMKSKQIEQSCTGSKLMRKGLWYRYKHTGSVKPIILSNYNSNVSEMPIRIEVYNLCNDRECVAQAAPGTDGYTNATFVASPGNIYNIFITSSLSSNPGGFFRVDFYEASGNEHSQCERAYVVPKGGFPYRLVDGTFEAKSSFSNCDNEERLGVWVTFWGTGRTIVATTCGQEASSLDTQLELYSRCPDGQPHSEYCLAVNDDAKGCGRASKITYRTDANAQYWLFITGYKKDKTGVFTLKLYEMSSLPNAKCSAAQSIKSLPYYDFGLTTYCDVSAASCTAAARKGNWYEIDGNDRWISLSTCNPETDYATEIEVYLSCNENAADGCVAHNHDNGCSPHTVISFPAFKGEHYYIFITGITGGNLADGFFGLTVTEGEPVAEYISSDVNTGLTPFQGFMVSVGVFMGVGVASAAAAVAFSVYKRHHVSYQEITA